MSSRQFHNIVQAFVSQLEKLVASEKSLRQQLHWLLRSQMIGQQTRNSEAGFVLPTVVMVTLVVVLLTTALVLRSFDRSRNARNFRVNETVLNAAAPALDRARAKIDALFDDPTLPRATPSEIALYNAIKSSAYDLPGERRLTLANNFNGTAGIQNNSNVVNDEITKTAWAFDVDTNNDGVLDSTTIYGIYFRTPARNAAGQFTRERNPLEARTPPMEDAIASGVCANVLGGIANLVGGSDWYKSGAVLKKSFFIYSATIPKTLPNGQVAPGAGFSALEVQQDRVRIPINNNAVWYEDDFEVADPGSDLRLNGRVFTNGNLLVRGRGTGSNDPRFQLYQVSSDESCYYQEENSKVVVAGNIANGYILDTTDLGDNASGGVDVHMFRGAFNNPTTTNISSTNKTTTEAGGRDVAYNNNAYEQRIQLMVQGAMNLHGTGTPTKATVNAVTRFPAAIKDAFAQRIDDPNETKEPKVILEEVIRVYFRERTRRVPYKEIATGASAIVKTAGAPPTLYSSDTSSANFVFGSSGEIMPPLAWMSISATNTGLALKYKTADNTMFLPATEPDKQRASGVEDNIGDRIIAGNGLPAIWYDTATSSFQRQGAEQPVVNSTTPILWNLANGNADTIQRTRESQIATLPDLGSTERDGYWERQAALKPEVPGTAGGLRVIVGAGIYRSDDTASTDTEVWPDYAFVPDTTKDGGSNPEAHVIDTETNRADGNPNDDKPYLKMRAAVVYHYANPAIAATNQVDVNQVPLACVSSYYDPTNATTALNATTFPLVNGATLPTSTDHPTNAGGKSNNGIVYPAPYSTHAARIAAVATNITALTKQANLTLPGGARYVNPTLRAALTKFSAAGALNSGAELTMADNSAIDAAVCAIKILDDTSFTPAATPPIPHNAIREASFLDGRQVRTLHRLAGSGGLKIPTLADLQNDSTGVYDDKYDLPLEQRQPIEVRTTDIKLGVLAGQTIGTADTSTGSGNQQEYALPNSGIVYVAREDAYFDGTVTTTGAASPEQANMVKSLSATDFRVDPTRRPTGVRLVEGADLARKDTYRVAEKGLILATELPVYIKAQDVDTSATADPIGFNLHKRPDNNTIRAEFLANKLTTVANWDFNSFYGRARNNLDPNFACREGQPGCGSGSDVKGDQWRPVTIIGDSVTMLSHLFKDGYRDLGGYDVRENIGDAVAADKRLKLGFWLNDFVINPGGWWETGSTNTFMPTDASKNAYFTNGVTPIQRRANFQEYLMEYCPKLPVSECKQRDWYVDHTTGLRASTVVGENYGTNPGRYKAGTTAVAPDSTVARYPRRIAIARRANGTLDPDVWNEQAMPMPIGILDGGVIAKIRYSTFDADNATTVPRLTDGALWYATTSTPSTVANPADYATRSYRTNKPLAYAADFQAGSPPTVDLPGGISLNTPTDNPASSYTICTEAPAGNSQGTIKGGSKKFSLDKNSTLEQSTCPTNVRDAITNVITTLNGITFTGANTVDTTGNYARPTAITLEGTTTSVASSFPSNTTTGKTVIVESATTPASNGSVFNVIDLSANNFNTTTTCSKIRLKGNANSVFIFRTPSRGAGALSIGGGSGHCGVQVEVEDGVDINNIFWVFNSNVQWEAVDPNPSQFHKWKGTLLMAGTAIPEMRTVEIEGRLFNSQAIAANNVSSDSSVQAIATDGQPKFIPMLQIHTPEGLPSTATNDTYSNNTVFKGRLPDRWLPQVPTSTTIFYNAALVTGHTPSRPQESNGGFLNFPRFLEDWARLDTTANDSAIALISGGFIQSRVSAYATAAFDQVDGALRDSGTFTQGSSASGLSLFYKLDQATNTKPLYNSRSGALGSSDNDGYRYPGGGSLGRAPFYLPPTRLWGFDVALLTQAPDAFAQRFTIDPTTPPSEYFREVGRDDPWIQTLLCAAATDGTGGNAFSVSEGGTTVSYKYYLPASQRPSNCNF